MDLKNYQGKVQKSAAVYSNDPQQPQVAIMVKADVKAFIELKPNNVVYFRGLADQIEPMTVDLVAGTDSFHIKDVQTNLADKISYQMETVEDGKHYRMRVTNKLSRGRYAGFIKCLTDHPKNPEVLISVSGYIEDEVSVNPLAVLVGKLAPGQEVRSGNVVVINNRNKDFQITKLTYDEQLIQVTQQPLPNQKGYRLKVDPKLDNIPDGQHRATTMTVETDVANSDALQVRVNVINR